MIKIELKNKIISFILKNPILIKDMINNNLKKITEATVEKFYKEEAPVFRGDLRRKIKTVKTGEYSVFTTTTAENAKGFKYPLAVHEGTLDFKNSPVDYGGSGRSGVLRSKNKKQKYGFNYIDKKSGKRGIRPNKFADRAKKLGEPKLIKNINNLIFNLIKK